MLFFLQLFNQADPALADLDETPDHMGADLMASRHDAWEELVMSKVRLCVDLVFALNHNDNAQFVGWKAGKGGAAAGQHWAFHGPAELCWLC
jgi:hypothetical protein